MGTAVLRTKSRAGKEPRKKGVDGGAAGGNRGRQMPEMRKH